MKRPAKNKNAQVLDASVLEALVGAVRPAELTADERASMREKIARRIANEQPAATQTIRGDSVEWATAWPNVRVKLLRQDAGSNLQMVLFRIEPGGVVPGHVHSKEEECLVLEGEIFIGTHRVGAGDLHIALPGAEHDPITTKIGATVLVRSEIPPSYLRRLLAAR